MSEIAEFLLARILEDEQTARAAVQLADGREIAGWYWSGAGDAVFLDDTSVPVACGAWQEPMHQPSALHIARWDPARVLAECDARRQIVEREVDTPVLRLLALAHAGHPDYRQEWRPEG